MAESSHPVGTVRREDLPAIRDRGDVVAESERLVDREEYELAEDRSDEGDYPVGAIVRDDRDRILLIRNWAPGWTVPAGLAKHGETMETAAAREVREETGVEATMTDVAYVKESELVHPDREATRSGYFVVFEGRATDPELGDPADLGEEGEGIDDVGWFEELPDEVYNRETIEAILDR